MAVPGTKPQNFTTETTLQTTDLLLFLKDMGAGVWQDSNIIPENVRIALSTFGFKGDWNASTNTPALVSSTGNLGDLYRVSVDGATTLDAVTEWVEGDWAYFDGSVWRKQNGNPPPEAVKDSLTVTSDGQTAFTLSETPNGNAGIRLIVNHAVYERIGVDFNFSGTTLTWLDPDGVTLKTTDQFTASYNTEASTGVPTTREIILSGTNYGANDDDYRTSNIGATGNQNYTFYMPSDFVSFVSFKVIGIVSAGAAGSGKDIDLSSTYASVGEPANTHTETDVGTTYTFVSGQINDEIDLTVVLSTASAGDSIGINVDHNGIGGGLGNLYLRMVYNI